MGLETGTYISDLVNTNPDGAVDNISEGDDHFRLLKDLLLNTLTNANGAINPTPAEFNKLAGLLTTAAELTKLNGFTGLTADLNAIAGIAAAGVTPTEIGYLNNVTSSIQTQLAARLVAASNLSDLSSAATSRTNLGLGALATLNSVTASQIDTNAVGQPEVAAAAVGQGELKTATVSLSGSIGDTNQVNITLNSYAFFPMIHTSGTASSMQGHATDGASADAPRFAFSPTTYGGTETYDVDYRHMSA